MSTLVTEPTTETNSSTTTGTEPTPTVTPQAPPTVDWLQHVPKGHEKSFEAFKGKSLSDVLNAHVEAQKFIGGSIRLPKPDASPEERSKSLADIYNKLGRPESPDKYDLGELPVVNEQFKWDEGRLNAAKSALHKAGLTNDQAKAVLGLYATELQNLFPDQSTVAAESKAKLIEEYGSEGLYNRNLSMARKAVSTYADQELINWLEQSGMGNHPPFVKFMAKIGHELVEHGATDPATPNDYLTPAQAQAEISKIMNDPKDLYFQPRTQPGVNERRKHVEELFKIVAGEA